MGLGENRFYHSKELKIAYYWARFGVVKVHIHLRKIV